MIIRESTRLPRQFRDGVGATQVHDLVFAVTANELAQENKYKELQSKGVVAPLLMFWAYFQGVT